MSKPKQSPYWCPRRHLHKNMMEILCNYEEATEQVPYRHLVCPECGFKGQVMVLKDVVGEKE